MNSGYYFSGAQAPTPMIQQQVFSPGHFAPQSGLQPENGQKVGLLHWHGGHGWGSGLGILLEQQCGDDGSPDDVVRSHTVP
jgi:hypothetical protein